MKTPKIFGLLAVLVMCFFVMKTSAQQYPILLSTTVQNDGSVLISWDTEVAGNDENYIIYRWSYDNSGPGGSQGGFPVLNIVNSTFGQYLDYDINANQKKQIYQLGLEGENDEVKSEIMQTVYLYEVTYNECALTNTIRWTGFFDTFNPVSYNISAIMDDATNFTILETLTSSDLVQVGEISTYENTSPHKTPVYEYTHEGLDPDQTYTYKVEAVYDINGERQTSGSNLQSRNTPAYQRPDPPKIKSVSVNENNEIEIFGEITAPGSATINSSSIWRTNSQNPIDLSFYTDLNQTGNVNYTDEAVSTNETAYWYSLVLEDKCQFPIPDDPAENAHRSIFLTAEVINNEQVELNWNAYEGWTPDHYLIFRKTTTDAYIEIGSPQQTQYTDNTIADGDESGSIIYFVQAVSEDQSTGAKITASSNRVRVGFDSPFFVPNAFRPSANITKNQLFKPLSRFSPAGGYLFQIYDRWGRLLFESTDFSKGWDGKVNGNESPQGVYLWRYSYNNSEGKTLEDKGTVMLIR